MDYATAVHRMQAYEAAGRVNVGDPPVGEVMHRAITAISLLGPVSVSRASDRISEVLRATPISEDDLDVAYEEFVRHAAISLTRGSWWSWQVFRRKVDQSGP